ncbi:hypothetical protein D3C73_941560 [compost metagenome]
MTSQKNDSSKALKSGDGVTLQKLILPLDFSSWGNCSFNHFNRTIAVIHKMLHHQSLTFKQYIAVLKELS